jgi:hypothetical protein
MGGSGSGRQDDGGTYNVEGVPDNGGRLRAAEVVAMRLGELLEELLADLRSLPRWRPANGKRREIERAVSVGLVMFHAWQDAFEVWPEAGNGR